MVKTENLLNSHFQASLNPFMKSWEEQAFAEDAAGPLGGFVWPPRSYTCSFCKREFRSAQALGGHMNIHRRDRAKQKQSLSPPCCDHLLHHQHNHPCDQPSEAPNSYQLCTLDSSLPDPNSNPSFAASPHSPSAVEDNFSTGHTYVSPFNSSIVKESQEDFPYASQPSLSDYKGSVRGFSTSGSKSALLSHDDDDHIETNLSVGLTLVVSQKPSIGSLEGEEADSRKTRKAAVSSLPFFLRPCSEDAYPFQSEVFGLKSSSMEDIDLELRLGVPPKMT